MAKEYYITIGDKKVQVTEEVYRAYKRPAWTERKRRQVRTDMERSLDVFINDGFDIPSDDALIEEIVEDKLLLDMLLTALDELTADEGDLINALFYQGKSEREYASITNVAQQTVHKKKVRILEKLKQIMNFEK